MKYTESERLEFAMTHKEEWLDNVYEDEQVKPNIEQQITLTKGIAFGWDGFGYARAQDGSLVKIPHAGNVVIAKDVEIRAFVTIDRAVIGSTTIGQGTKIDHHCHIAHGAQIGKHNTFANGCIIEGSCVVGDYNTFGAGVIVQTKVKIGNWCKFGSGAVVTKDVPDNSIMVGNPARQLEKK